MTIPSPEHFFEQAEKHLAIPGKGAPQQVDVRRAISATYYWVPFLIALIFIILRLVLLSMSAIAADAEQMEERYTEWLEEVNKTKRDNPDEHEKMLKTFTLFAQLELAKLGYTTRPFNGILDDKTRDSLRAYEMNKGLQVTGDPLSLRTIIALRADSETYHDNPVSLPSINVVTNFWDSGYVSAAGTWVISGESQASSEQTSKIECQRDLGRCIEATAIISTSGGDKTLFLYTDTYEIERWDKYEIVTKPLQFECARYTRRFNRLQESVTGIRSTISSNGACAALDRTDKYLVLTDGRQIYTELTKQATNRWGKVLDLSPDLMSLLK